MEAAILVLGLGGLYIINKQQSNSSETFENRHHKLPNEDIPNRNYPEEYPIQSTDLDQTSYLSKNNAYQGGEAYTDKYFVPTLNASTVADGNSNSNGGVGTKYYSMTGEQVGSDYFNHNNMVPYFGSNLRNVHVDAQSYESILDTHTGAGSQIFSKTEQSPLFSPHDNMQWSNGAPNASDFYQSRVNPSMRMANVKPFAEEKVAPGLGLGFTTEGAGGFNSGMAMRENWLDRGVDELRVANKQKASGLVMLGHEGPADSYVKIPGKMGAMEKNRPDTHFELGQDRLFTTTGMEKGQTLHGIPIFHPQSRAENSVQYIGAASGQQPTTYLEGEYMPTHNQPLGAYPFMAASAVGRHGAVEEDYGAKSTFAHNNNRTQNEQDNYYGIVGGVVGAVVAPLLDVLRPSRRENTVQSLRPYQNPKSEVPQSYLFNPDRLATTMRETTEQSKYHLNVENQSGVGAYNVAGNQPINNNRMTTGDFYYAGGSSAGHAIQNPRTYDAAYKQRNNDIKSSTIQGYMVQGNMNLLNADINMRTSAYKDNVLENRRDVAPVMPAQTPDRMNMGRLQGSSAAKANYSNIQLDRNSPEILDTLKTNPYALSVTNVFA